MAIVLGWEVASNKPIFDTKTVSGKVTWFEIAMIRVNGIMTEEAVVVVVEARVLKSAGFRDRLGAFVVIPARL